MTEKLILSDINKSFNGKNILTDFNYSFSFRNIYKISGPNGSGKTTLFKLITGIYEPDSGSIELSLELKKNISYVDSNPRSFFHRLNVLDNLKYFLSLHCTNYHISFINELMDYFEISALKKTIFSDLSQGQMQLISIIRGLSFDSKIIIFDESFTSLDFKNRSKLQNLLLTKYQKQNKLILFCSHDDNFFESRFIEINLS